MFLVLGQVSSGGSLPRYSDYTKNLFALREYLFQPAHGSAPDILGQNKANPLATILSASLMLEYLSDKTKCKSTELGSRLIETAIEIGFERNELRPIEFGGDMGTTAITKTLSDLLKDNEIQKQILT